MQQEPELEVPTIYKAYCSGLWFREYPSKIWPNIWYVYVPPSIGSWRSPIELGITGKPSEIGLLQVSAWLHAKKNRSRTCARSHIAKPIFLGDNHGLEKKTPIFVGRWGQLKGSQPQINHHPLKIRKFFNREKSSRNCQLSCHFPVRKNFHSWSPQFPPMLRCCRVEVDPFPWDLQVSWLLLMIRGYITW